MTDFSSLSNIWNWLLYPEAEYPNDHIQILGEMTQYAVYLEQCIIIAKKKLKIDCLNKLPLSKCPSLLRRCKLPIFESSLSNRTNTENNNSTVSFQPTTESLYIPSFSTDSTTDSFSSYNHISRDYLVHLNSYPFTTDLNENSLSPYNSTSLDSAPFSHSTDINTPSLSLQNSNSMDSTLFSSHFTDMNTPSLSLQNSNSMDSTLFSSHFTGLNANSEISFTNPTSLDTSHSNDLNTTFGEFSSQTNIQSNESIPTYSTITKSRVSLNRKISGYNLFLKIFKERKRRGEMSNYSSASIEWKLMRQREKTFYKNQALSIIAQIIQNNVEYPYEFYVEDYNRVTYIVIFF